MIFVTGATGTIGQELVRLLAKPRQPARALCRSPEKAQRVRQAGVEAVLGDFDAPDALAAAMHGCDRLFLLSGPRPDQAALECGVIDAAARAGIRHVVALSSVDVNPDSPVPWARWHAEADAYLRGSGLTWTLLKPAAFMQNFLSWAPMIAEGTLYGIAGDGRAPWVDTRDVAAVAARVLLDGGSEHATYFLTGPDQLSMTDAAARLSETLDRPVNYRNIPSDAYRARLLERGMPAWMADGIVEQYRTVLAGGHGSDVTHEVATVTGRPARSFADFVRDHRHVFGQQPSLAA